MGGTPLPPFTDKIFGKKGVTDLGGTPPPPFTDKIRKVVFEVPPYDDVKNGWWLTDTLSGEFKDFNAVDVNDESATAFNHPRHWDSHTAFGEKYKLAKLLRRMR